ncbi:hypothetical protein NW767_012756 [Fusarium falciforme]|nr:hypothetical protein NW767_012756 [Fusarium falciforme]KAJ4243014.1 hypothetical protein NW757_011545 [Fusarium falciforme]
MESEDLRKKHDLVTQARSVTWILNLRLPPVPDGLPPTSGLECLVVVTCRIYSAALIADDCLANLNGFKKSEAQNPILAFSWLMFGEPKGAEACARAVKVKCALLEAIPESKASFEALWTSDMMNQTCRADFVKPIEWTRQEVAEASIIRLDRAANSQLTLQEAVDNCFGIENNTLLVPYRPRVIRVYYTPGMRDRLPFQALREFFLPQGSVRTVDGRVRYIQDELPMRYALIAVVRMRSGPHEGDNVRTYRACGANIAAQCEPRSYTPGTWLIKEPSPHNFALFFCLAGNELLISEYPELQKPARMIDPEEELAVEEELACALQRIDLEATTGWAPRFKDPGTEPLPSDPSRSESRAPGHPSSSSSLPQAQDPAAETRPAVPPLSSSSLPPARDSVSKIHPPSGPKARSTTNPQGQSSQDEQVASAEDSARGNQTGANPKRARPRCKGKNAAPGGSDRSNHQHRGGGQGKNGSGRARNARHYSPPPSSRGQRTRGPDRQDDSRRDRDQSR